jgi:acetolactate synthase-1/2/3 large subunit
MELLSTQLTENMKITTGVGNHQMLAAQYLVTKPPKSFISSGGFGTMGFALPNAVGTHYANPGATVLAIDGDGSLLMNLGELFTIGRYNLPIKVLLLNNHGECMVRNYQKFVHAGNYVATRKVNGVNFAAVAKDLSFAFATRIDDRKNLADGLNAFLQADGPCFLEVICDEDEMLYPRIPAGQGYAQMILGPHMEDKA